MGLAEMMIGQTFTNAGFDDVRMQTSMTIGTLKAIGGQQPRSILLVDNGLGGPKVIALTTRALFIIDRNGNVSEQLPLAQVTSIKTRLNTIAVSFLGSEDGRYEAKNTYNVADSVGVYDLISEFDDLRSGQ